MAQLSLEVTGDNPCLTLMLCVAPYKKGKKVNNSSIQARVVKTPVWLSNAYRIKTKERGVI